MQLQFIVGRQQMLAYRTYTMGGMVPAAAAAALNSECAAGAQWCKLLDGCNPQASGAFRKLGMHGMWHMDCSLYCTWPECHQD